jgi:hypothetical protein
VTRALTTTMQLSITHLLQRILRFNSRLFGSTNRTEAKSRALFSLGGRIAHYLFGTAEDSTVEELRKQIADMKLMSDSALADSSKTRQVMSDYYSHCESRWITCIRS